MSSDANRCEAGKCRDRDRITGLSFKDFIRSETIWEVI